MQDDKNRLTVISLALSRSTPQMISLVGNLFLIDIALTFGKQLGEASQMMTLSSILGAATALAMTFLTIRFSPTHLHNLGLIFCVISVLGCIFTPVYSLFFILYGISGIGSTLVVPMTTTITGELTSGEERSRSLGTIMAGPALFYLIGYLAVGFIADWRLAFIYFSTPLIALSAILSLRILPVIELKAPNTSLSMGIRKIFGDRSAISCLLTKVLTGVWIVFLSFAASFFRDSFNISILTISLIFAGGAFIYAFGAFYGGRFIPRFGSKNMTTITWILMGLFLIIIMNIGNAFISLAMAYLLSLISGINLTASTGLTLSQVPEYRGSMMSLNSASASLGTSLNIALMGFLLTNYGWGIGSIVVGVLGILSGVLNHILVTEKNE